MRRKLFIPLVTAILIILAFAILPKSKALKPPNQWALIAHGMPPDSFYPHDIDYAEEILIDHYGFTEGMNLIRLGPAQLNDVRYYITNWLKPNSKYGDLVFIFLYSLGGGYDIRDNQIHGCGRLDLDGDEGPEHYDETAGQWYGVDEGLWFAWDNGYYYDDLLKQDLAGIEYGRMIMLLCGSYCGGFIDDLKGPRRTILAASNETTPCYSLFGNDGFTRAFLDAIHPDPGTTYPGYDPPMAQAFFIARDNDPYYGPNIYNDGESPWFSSDPNLFPDFINGANNAYGESGFYMNNFAFNTWININRYTDLPDVNYDYKVDMLDLQVCAQNFGRQDVNDIFYLVDVNYDHIVNMLDMYIISMRFGEIDPQP